MAHQTLGQIQSRGESALANVNVKVVFALDYEDAKVFARKLFVDYVGNINWEQATATIQKLRRRTALVKWRGERLAKIQTMFIPEYQVSAREVETLMAGLSRTHGIFHLQQAAPPMVQTTPSSNPPLADWETESNL
jgi:hypothetical protein